MWPSDQYPQAGQYAGANNGDMQPGPLHSNLFVRNLPPEFGHNDVKALFEPFGKVVGCKFVSTAHVPYAFVRLELVESAQTAVNGLNGQYIGGRQLLVKFADADGQNETPNSNLYVKGVPNTWNEESIRIHLSPFGNIISVRLLAQVDNAESQNALVRMSTVEEAVKARNALHGVAPEEHTDPLVIRFAETAEDKARRKAPRQKFPAQRFSPYQAQPGPDQGASFSSDPTSHQQQQQPQQQGQQPGYMAGQMPNQSVASNWNVPHGSNGYQLVQQNTAPPTNITNSQFSAPAQQIQAVPPWHLPSETASGPNMVSHAQAGFAQGPDANRQQISASTGPPPFQNVNTAGMPGSSGNMFPASVPNQNASPVTLFVSGLPPDFTELLLYRHFAPLGAVLNINTRFEQNMGTHVAFITYKDGQTAFAAMQATNGNSFGPYRISVSMPASH